jgi:AcrR family transcriptional regulator
MSRPVQAASGRAPSKDREGKPPRERILDAAARLFYRDGIRAVGVEAIAAAARTNKMTLYRHFESKDALVAEYLRRLARESDTTWDAIAAAHPGDPRAQLQAWLETVRDHLLHGDDRGCALANAAIELPEKNHPARCVIEDAKIAQRARLVQVCRAAGVDQPESLADELFLLVEGARVTLQSMGPKGPAARLVRLGQALIAARLAA